MKLTLIMILILFHGHSTWASTGSEEARFHQLMNQFRQILGLQKLEIHPALQAAAQKHSLWMAEKEFLTHNGPNPQDTLVTRAHVTEGYPYRMLGENVACGNDGAVETFLQWAFSPGHLKNMINPEFDEMGIARSGDGEEKCPYYWTHDFGSRKTPATKTNWILDPVRIKAAIQQVTGKEPAEIRLEIQ